MSEDVQSKLELTRQEIRALKSGFDNDVDITDVVPYTDQQLEAMLQKLPVVMFHQSQASMLKLIEFRDAKRNLKQVMGRLRMQAGHNPDLKASDDRKAWVDAHPDVEAAEIQVINAEAEFRMSELHLASYDNLYTALKKIISIHNDQNVAQGRYAANQKEGQ